MLTVYNLLRFKKVQIMLVLIACGLSMSARQSNISENTKTKITVDTTKSSWWYSGQAKEKYENKNYKGAIQDFTKAIIIDPEVPEFYYYRGNSYAFNKESKNALNDYKKALELNPDYLSAINNLGWEYLKRREFSSAIRYFINYLKLVPKDPKLFFGIGLNTDYLNLLNNLGWETLRDQQLPEAIRYFKNYLKLAPNDPDAYLGMALIYYKYRDIENAHSYLNQAKELEPALYQGFAGITALENAGCIYTDADKALIKQMFLDVNDKKEDLQTITKSGALKFLLGFMYIILGIIAMFIFSFRIKRFEGYIFYLGLLNLSFGLKFLYDNPLIRLTEIPSPTFWEYAMPIIAFIIPVAFILFIRYFIGWGWKKSILWLLIYSVFQGVVKIIADYSEPAQDIYGTTNTIFGLLAAVVLFSHLFLPDMRKNREVQIIGAGLGFYLLAILYDNLAQMQWLPEKLSFDEPAYLFFNVCLIYVAIRRITNTEKEFLAVKQDLETARNIQNAILPDINPKGEKYEVASAYMPMALIGGDYYDYHLKNQHDVGILIADVSGHGISAALIASMIKVAFNSQVGNAQHPATVLQRMNMGLSDQLNNEFITAGYLGLNLKTKKIIYSSAGHPPLIIYRRKINEMKEISVPGIPIGVFPETSFRDTTFQVKPGDRLILYTDGVMDAMNKSGEQFGKQRFMDLIIETKNLLAEDAIDSMVQKINRWSELKENEAHEDDITLIILDIL